MFLLSIPPEASLIRNRGTGEAGREEEKILFLSPVLPLSDSFSASPILPVSGSLIQCTHLCTSGAALLFHYIREVPADSPP